VILRLVVFVFLAFLAILYLLFNINATHIDVATLNTG